MEIAIKKLFAQLLFWLYEFLDSIFEMFQVLCGIQSVEYTENGETVERSIVEIFLQSSAVTKAFLLIFLVAIVVCAVSVIVSVVKNMINMKGGERKSHAKTVGQGFGSIIVTLVLGFIMIFGIWGSNQVLGQVYVATVGDSSLSVSNRLFAMSVSSSYQYNYSELREREVQATDENGNLLWDTADGGTSNNKGDAILDDEGQPKKHMVKEYYYDYLRDPETNEPLMLDGWCTSPDGKKYSAADIVFGKTSVDEVFGKHDENLLGLEKKDGVYELYPMVELESFNMLTAYFVVIMLLVALIWSMLGLVKRIFDMVALFIMLPLISATIPLDDGARLKVWRETVVSKVVLAYGAVISVNVFMMIIPVIENLNFASIGWSTFGSNIFKMVMLIGGALSINGGQLLIARVMGTSAEESRELAQSARALMSGAMAAGGIAHSAKNAVFGGRNKYGRETQGILPLIGKGAGAVTNATGKLLGGQAYTQSASAVADRARGVMSSLRGVGALNQGANRNSAANGAPGRAAATAAAGGEGQTPTAEHQNNVAENNRQPRNVGQAFRQAGLFGVGSLLAQRASDRREQRGTPPREAVSRVMSDPKNNVTYVREGNRGGKGADNTSNNPQPASSQPTQNVAERASNMVINAFNNVVDGKKDGAYKKPDTDKK